MLEENTKDTLNCKKNKPFNTNRSVTRSFFGSTNDGNEAQIFWPHNAKKTGSAGENSDARQNRR